MPAPSSFPFAFLFPLLLSLSTLCSGGMDLSNYVLTWDQDFTLLPNLSVSANGPCGPGGSTWMAHTPYYGDWARFLDPTADYEPFHLANGGPLTIRSQRQGNSKDLYAGLLASVDPKGRGFSQRYGVRPRTQTRALRTHTSPACAQPQRGSCLASSSSPPPPHSSVCPLLPHPLCAVL